MALTIGGIGSGFSYQSMQKTNSLLENTLNRLSSGLRINNAFEDASGLSISEGMRGQLRGFNRASSNIQDGISLLRTAEGGLSTMQEDMQRIRELTVQAGNGAYSDTEIKALENEARQLLSGINDSASRTQYNTKNLLDGSQAGRVTSATPGVEAYVRGGVSQSGLYSGEIRSSVDKNGEITREVVLKNGRSGQSSRASLDEYNRAQGLLGSIDLQLQSVEAAKTSASDIQFEDVMTLEGAAQATFTDANGDSFNLSLSAGNVAMDDIISQLNSGFSGGGVDLQASLNKDGNLVVGAVNAGEDFQVSGTNSLFRNALGISDGISIATSSKASLEGKTSESRVSEGVSFTSQVQFSVKDSGAVATTVSLGGAGAVMTRDEILKSVNDQLSGNQDVRASYDGDQMVFESVDAGRRASVEIKDLSSGSDTLSNKLGILDQRVQGSGSSTFTLNVQAGNLSFQTGANQNQSTSFALGDFSTSAMNLDRIDFSSQEGRDDFLSRLDSAMADVSSSRSSIGARENGFLANFYNLDSSSRNIADAESKIRDADLAMEAVKLSQQQALMNTAMYAQTQMLGVSSSFMQGLLG